MSAQAQDNQADIRRDFDAAVNMGEAALGTWLTTDTSRQVGWTQDGEDESVGHQSGRHILRLLRHKKADLTDADLAHMKKVIGYVHRHMAQRPHGNVSESRWRYSLMNWGHDPLRDSGHPT